MSTPNLLESLRPTVEEILREVPKSRNHYGILYYEFLKRAEFTFQPKDAWMLGLLGVVGRLCRTIQNDEGKNKPTIERTRSRNKEYDAIKEWAGEIAKNREEQFAQRSIVPAKPSFVPEQVKSGEIETKTDGDAASGEVVDPAWADEIGQNKGDKSSLRDKLLNLSKKKD